MNNFEILETIGEGTYSTVYKVLRKSDNCIYALKHVKILKLTQKEKQNALNEVRILASLSSPFIVKYKEAFFDIENACLA
jgi:NIMA (never in mitosis gene a)-related kinase